MIYSQHSCQYTLVAKKQRSAVQGEKISDVVWRCRRYNVWWRDSLRACVYRISKSHDVQRSACHLYQSTDWRYGMQPVVVPLKQLSRPTLRSKCNVIICQSIIVVFSSVSLTEPLIWCIDHLLAAWSVCSSTDPAVRSVEMQTGRSAGRWPRPNQSLSRSTAPASCTPAPGACR